MKSNYKRLFENIGIFTLANFASRFLSFLILPLYTYYLSTEEYGTLDLVSTTTQLVFPIFTLAISDSVMRFAISHKDKDKILSIGFIIIVIGLIPLLLISFFANILIGDFRLIIYFIVIYFVQAINSLFSSFTRAIDKTKAMATITTLTTLTILILNVYFIAGLKSGIEGYWLSTILGNLVGIIMYFLVCKIHRYFTVNLYNSVSKDLLLNMLMYSIPLIPNALFWWINSSLDRWTLTFFTSVSVVGLYSCANKIPTILSTVNSIFNQAWNLSLFQNEDLERNSFFCNVYKYYSEVMFCCTIGIIWLSKVIGTYMFSNEFFSAWIFVPILTMGVYYNSLNGFFGSLFTASKQTKYIFTTTLTGSIVNLVFNIPFVLIGGAMGAGIATLISYLTVCIVRVIKIRKIFNIKINVRVELLRLILLIVETYLIFAEKMYWLVTLFVFIYCVLFLSKIFKDRKIRR